jgi:hypothetical protein
MNQINNHYLRVSKMDYYTWKIGSFILLILILILIYKAGNEKISPEQQDYWWHIGFKDCQAQNQYHPDYLDYEIEQCTTFKVFCLHKGE